MDWGGLWDGWVSNNKTYDIAFVEKLPTIEHFKFIFVSLSVIIV